MDGGAVPLALRGGRCRGRPCRGVVPDCLPEQGYRRDGRARTTMPRTREASPDLPLGLPCSKGKPQMASVKDAEGNFRGICGNGQGVQTVSTASTRKGKGKRPAQRRQKKCRRGLGGARKRRQGLGGPKHASGAVRYRRGRAQRRQSSTRRRKKQKGPSRTGKRPCNDIVGAC